MSESEPTWIVLARDVSATITVQGLPQVVAGVVLDADTGLIRGVSMRATVRQACLDACRAALTTPAGPLPPRPPSTVVYHDRHAGEILAALRETLPDPGAPTLVAAPPAPEAEDILDSLVGHLAGRRQPSEPPDSDDWVHLFAQAAAYQRTRPWQLWSDAHPLDLVVEVDGEQTRYVAVVIGQAGIQLGLALYPGTEIPQQLGRWRPGQQVPLSEGSLVLWLDPPDESPAEYVAKAIRYGWPQDAELSPIPASIDSEGMSDLDRTSAHHLTVALAAVVAHQGPRRDQRTSGSTALADGIPAGFTIG